MLAELELKFLKEFFRRWYRVNGRDFAWRKSGVAPFHLLLAEMMLRQTNASKAEPIWISLTSQAEGPRQVLAIPEDELTILLGPLGLVQQRVKAIRDVSLVLESKFKGQVPRTPARIIELPHVGIYAANAIACFAYGKRVPIVDGNVLRVFSRISGNDFGKDNRRNKEVWALAEEILPTRGVREHNYGLLDFSADVCSARSPKHDLCPVRHFCSFYIEKK